LLFRARRRGFDVEVVHAPSILTAVAQTGLSLYKFGRTTTLTIQNGAVPGSVFDAVRENQAAGLHTLVLLDIGMTVNE
ncbi:MAG: diphthine synthase, partial [Candidatus Nanohaloarchaea archaeon]